MAPLTKISPRALLMELADTSMNDLSEVQQLEVRNAAGSLLVAMCNANGEAYVSDFVVVLDTGERVAYECILTDEVFIGNSQN